MSDPAEELDLFDRIAQDLPAETRAAYYRELNYCRSLPENDELLRVLRAMQFLTLLMREVPVRVAGEREKLEELFRGGMTHFSATLERTAAYQGMLEKRLANLPADVAQGLRPEEVAREINENLRQQFVASTLPATARAMTAVATQLRVAVTEFGKNAAVLHDAHRGAAQHARDAIQEIEQAISEAARTARHAAEELSTVFQREFRWSLYALSSLGIVVGLGLGMLYQHWVDSPPDTPIQQQPTVEKVSPKIKQRPGI